MKLHSTVVPGEHVMLCMCACVHVCVGASTCVHVCICMYVCEKTRMLSWLKIEDHCIQRICSLLAGKDFVKKYLCRLWW